MIHVPNILVPVDFSEPARKAVLYGLSLALQFKAKLVIAHIVPDYHTLDYSFPTETFELDRKAYEEARSIIPKLIPPGLQDKVSVETIVKVGDIRDEILNLVRDLKIDLVVMGSHGRRKFERFFLGSVTERMLRRVPVPLLTVCHIDPSKEGHDGAPPALKRILYATDLSEGSEDGLSFSIRLAKGLDARLTVVHALDMVEQILLGGGMVAYPPTYQEEIRTQMQERLDRTVALASDGSVPITTILADGPPYLAINDTAGRINADLIVLNLHGKGRLERAILGSNAERVIRTAAIPVLSLPMPATYAASWAG